MLKRFLSTASTLASDYNLLLILVLAAALHCWGITHGLPYSYYGDEIHFVKRALSFGSGDFNPHWFHKPAFYMYLLFFEYGVLFVLGRVAGAWSSVSEFAVQYIKDPYWFYLIGRISTCTFGVFCVWLVHRIGVKHFQKRVGMLGALFLTLTYGTIASAQVVKADVPAMFFAVASMLFVLNYVDSHRLRDLCIGTVAAALGAATKVYPSIMLLPIALSAVVVHWNRPGGLRVTKGSLVRALAVVTLIYGGTYFVATPYSILDPGAREWSSGSVRQLIRVSKQAVSGSETTGTDIKVDPEERSRRPSVTKYVRTLLGYRSAGLVLGTIGLLGVLYGVGYGSLKLRLILAFMIPFVTASILTHTRLMAPRHQVAIYPFLALCGAAAFIAFLDKLGRFRGLAYLMLTIGLLLPLYNIANHGAYASKRDTRNVAKEWIEQNIPAGAKLVVDENGPPLLPTRETILADLVQARLSDPKGQFTANYGTFLEYQLQAVEGETTYELSEIRKVWWSGSEEEDRFGVYTADSAWDREMGNPLKTVGVEEYLYYVDNGYEFAVVHGDSYQRFLEDTAAARNRPALRDFYRELVERGALIKEFTQEDGRFSGPTVRVYRLQ